MHGVSPDLALMLVLDRRVGEAIVIDGDIRIELLETRRGGVKLGITTTSKHEIVRSETLRLQQLKAKWDRKS